MVFTDPPYNVNYGDTAKDKLRSKAGTKAGRRQMVNLYHLGEEHLHAGGCGLSAPIQTDPLWLERWARAPLVRGKKSKRCLVRQQAC